MKCGDGAVGWNEGDAAPRAASIFIPSLESGFGAAGDAADDSRGDAADTVGLGCCDRLSARAASLDGALVLRAPCIEAADDKEIVPDDFLDAARSANDGLATVTVIDELDPRAAARDASVGFPVGDFEQAISWVRPDRLF